MLLYIIRHGDPDYATDSLTERGWAQAEAVGKRLAASGINRVFSSPMGRARQTAEPTCRLLDLSYTVEPWAHEITDWHRLTPYPDGALKSVSFVDRVDLRRDGAQDLSYGQAMLAPGFSESHMQDALDTVSAGAREFLAHLGYAEQDIGILPSAYTAASDVGGLQLQSYGRDRDRIQKSKNGLYRTAHALLL